MSAQGSGGDGPKLNVEVVSKLFGGSLIWVAMAGLVIVVVLVASIRIGRVTGEQVGVKLDKISGKITVIEESGVHLYNGILSDFFNLDKTIETLRMVSTSRGQGESLKVKTIDGSDVYVDLTVQYKMIPSMAETIMETSGPGNAFKEKWVRDYIRTMARNSFGELTTEQFYDSRLRAAQRLKAETQVREALKPFGIYIDSLVIPKRPVFYKEYEEMIKKKKVADQTVLEEQSKALAAKQKQENLKQTATNQKNVAVEGFKGDMMKLKIDADAAARREMKEADAYFTKTTVAAKASLYEMQQQAEGIRKKKEAEAKGIEALKEALEGEGGRNMVKMEYARRLKDVVITGQPFTRAGNTERFEHLGPAASQRGRTK